MAVLMELSGWSGHAERFPEVAHRRPIDLTSVVIGGCRRNQISLIVIFSLGSGCVPTSLTASPCGLLRIQTSSSLSHPRSHDTSYFVDRHWRTCYPSCRSLTLAMPPCE